MEKSRRDFLKKIGLSLTAAATGMATANAQNNQNRLAINESEQDFLEKYQLWVDEFKKVVEVQKTDLNNKANNRRLAELAEQSAEWKPELQKHLLNTNFAQEYLKISVQLTNKIENDHPFG